jgi:flagellar M-ring protein FliF
MQKNAGLDPSQLKYIKEVEQAYTKRIEEILIPVVGAGNVRARVAADVDFSQTEQVAETYKPNPAPGTAIRSQQTAEVGSASPEATGVPGALSNQPPAPATAPITQPAAAGTPGGAGAAGQRTPQNFTKNATTNFEVDKTVSHTKGMPGSVRRLSVAVVLNHKRPLDKDGKPGKAVALTAAEVKQATDLVREAMGFSQPRGDTLNVTNAPFTPPQKETIADAPIWKDPQLIAQLWELAKYAVFGIFAWLTWTKLLRPVFERLATMVPARPSKAALEEEANLADAMQHKASYEQKLAATKDLARKDPKVVAGMIKDWVGGGEQA